MAQECEGRVSDALMTVCPLQCWLPRDAASDNSPEEQAPARYHVDWAGFPVNLDLAFSPQQREKVYLQHLLRKRSSQLRRGSRDVAQLCVCDVTARHGHLESGAASLT